MVNNCGVHVGVGEVCAASGSAHSETAMAGISGRIATVRACIKFFISKRVYQTRPCLVKLPITPGGARVPRAGERVLAIANFQSATLEERAMPGPKPGAVRESAGLIWKLPTAFELLEPIPAPEN